eukprot:8646646-Alexandrium_andersonii.AAC.1
MRQLAPHPELTAAIGTARLSFQPWGDSLPNAMAIVHVRDKACPGVKGFAAFCASKAGSKCFL